MYYKLIECMHCVSYVFFYSIFLHDHSQRIQANLILWSFCTYFFSARFFVGVLFNNAMSERVSFNDPHGLLSSCSRVTKNKNKSHYVFHDLSLSSFSIAISTFPNDQELNSIFLKQFICCFGAIKCK